MKASERTVYKCDYCGKNYLMKHACGNHEKYCGKNPDNRHACFTCNHLSVDRESVGNESGSYSEKTFTCTKLDKQLHSFKAEKIQHSCLGYTERMPLQCESFDDMFKVLNSSQDF
jgi:hypothetical protein